MKQQKIKVFKAFIEKTVRNETNVVLADHRNSENAVYKDKQEASFCINYSAQSSAPIGHHQGVCVCV